MAPERICGELLVESDVLKNANKADLWPIGVLIHVFLFGAVPFDGETYSKLVKKIKFGYIKPKKIENDKMLDSLVDLMNNLLKVNVDERFNAVKALEHEFFRFKPD